MSVLFGTLCLAYECVAAAFNECTRARTERGAPFTGGQEASWKAACSFGNSARRHSLLDCEYGHVHHLPSYRRGVRTTDVRSGRARRDSAEHCRRSNVAGRCLVHWDGRARCTGGATSMVVAVQRPTGYAVAPGEDRNDRGESCAILGPRRPRSVGAATKIRN